jgi:peptidyl-prolyl cis-trans isomerase C
MSANTIPAIRALLTRQAMQRGLLQASHTQAQADDAIERLLDTEVVTPEPTEEECSRYYALHPDAFTSGDLVFARHILFAVTPGAPIALIREQAEKVLQEVRTHADRFGALAGQYSNCPSAQQGGSLGQLSRGDCVPEFEQALFEGRATGVLPRLVKTRFGFHVVAIDQRVPGKSVPYEAVREQIAARLYARVQEKALAQYVQVLAGVFAVEIPGVAAAASPLVQ